MFALARSPAAWATQRRWDATFGADAQLDHVRWMRLAIRIPENRPELQSQ
jgi:hypothetical protein